MQVSPFPWRPLAAFLLALAAQTLLEPPARIPAALALYLLAGALAVWSFRRREWTLPDSFSSSSAIQLPVANYRLLPLLASLPLLGAAFYLFGENQFTPLNLSLWLAGIAFFLRAVWAENQKPYTDGIARPVPQNSFCATSEQDKSCNTGQPSRSGWFLPSNTDNANALRTDILKKEKSVFLRAIRVIRVPHLLFLSILLIAAFFRFYRLAQVPAEPFSDHAEKILDVYDITQGETRIFFPRNTGREAIQFYWTLLIAAIFQTGLTFQTLKIGTAILGFLTLPFLYLLGKEIANPRAGLLAMLLAGIAYWPNVISRVGLRFPLYPLFVAPTLFFLLRGLRTRRRNNFLFSGLFLGLGLHGYTPFRIVPLLILLTFILYALCNKQYVIRGFIHLFAIALVLFLPLLRYALENPGQFWFRASSRAVVENPLPIFFSNLWNALLMFNVNDGNIFVNSIVHRPALDAVTGALFVLGLILLLARRRFLDLWLAAAILTLILPSALSLAYPGENPALNRAAGALVPVFLVVGMTLDGLLTALSVGLNRNGESVIAAGVVGILFAASAAQNYDLVFRQFREQYDRVVWRTSEMGAAIAEFGHPESVWIVPYEHWVDTRLPAMWAGIPNRDLGLPRERLADTLQLPPPKLFIFKASPLAADFDDKQTLMELQRLYPQGELTLHESEPWWQSFWIYFVPAP